MTKHRLMLSAATAALLAAPLTISAARAATTITDTRKEAINTTTLGDITITSGGVDIKATGAAVIVNSSNFLLNQGSISNQNTAGAIGILVDTSAGDLVNSAGITNLGSINLTGNGTGKSAILIQGGHTLYAPISFNNIISTTGGTVAGSSVSVVGDTSNIFTLLQGTTIDGDVIMGGTMVQTASDKIHHPGQHRHRLGRQSQRQFHHRPGCDPDRGGQSGARYRHSGSAGAVRQQFGSGLHLRQFRHRHRLDRRIRQLWLDQCAGHRQSQSQGRQFRERQRRHHRKFGCWCGFFNAGPSTSNGTTPNATITGNGDIVSGSTGSVFAPTVLIDPSQTVSSLNPTVRGPAIFGPVGTQIDSVDGGKGYGFINHGTITAQPIDLDADKRPGGGHPRLLRRQFHMSGRGFRQRLQPGRGDRGPAQHRHHPRPGRDQGRHHLQHRRDRPLCGRLHHTPG